MGHHPLLRRVARLAGALALAVAMLAGCTSSDLGAVAPVRTASSGPALPDATHTRPPKPSRQPKPPKPSHTPATPAAAGPACPGASLRGVYHPYRLRVLGTCRWYRGTVLYVRDEDDGDYHVVVKPDAGFARFLDADNYSQQHGGLVTEIMPGQHLPIPASGEHVSVFGTWAYDADHGWNEIHPIWAIRYLSRGGRLVSSLPVVPPRHDSSGGGSTGGGGGGGGSCNPSYPTICLPVSGPDLNCTDIQARNFKVLPPDPYGLDGDHNGVGCET